MRKPTPESDAAIELAASRWIGRRDAGMTAAEKSEWEQWQAADPRHARAFARHEQTWKSFDRPGAAGQADALIAALAASRVRRKRRLATRVVAGIAVGAFASLLWYPRSVPIAPEFPSAPLAAHTVVSRPEKQTLSDGSRVELKSGAEIRAEYTATRRRVILVRGEAYFQVAKSRVPFVVSTQEVEVRAVGTEFSVELDGKAVEVVVTEGRVSVEQPASGGTHDQPVPTKLDAVSAPHAIATVDAAHRLVVDLAAPTGAPATVVPVTPPELAQRLAWRAARLEFTDTPLQTAVEYFNRYSENAATPRLKIDPKDASLARLEVSGYFRADNVEAFLHLLEKTIGLTVDRQAGQVVLRRSE